MILHSRSDDVMSYADSEVLAKNNRTDLVEISDNPRLSDPGPPAAMLKACE